MTESYSATYAAEVNSSLGLEFCEALVGFFRFNLRFGAFFFSSFSCESLTWTCAGGHSDELSDETLDEDVGDVDAESSLKEALSGFRPPRYIPVYPGSVHRCIQPIFARRIHGCICESS